MSAKGMFGCVLMTELQSALKADGADVKISDGKNVQAWLRSVLEFVTTKHELDKKDS